MPDEFPYDVFLSHSAKDKAVVRDVAERLRKDGLRVWFDEWEMPKDEVRRMKEEGPTHPSSFKLHPLVEQGLERSRVLVLCMSANAFGSDWAQLESGTFRFRDPLNKERRFLPLRLDDAPIKGSLAQFLYINWLPEVREQEYAKLLEVCQSHTQRPGVEIQTVLGRITERFSQLNSKAEDRACVFSKDGSFVFTSSSFNNSMRMWDAKEGVCLRSFEGHAAFIGSIALSANQRLVASGSYDASVRVWDVDSGKCQFILTGHGAHVGSLAFSEDQRLLLSGSDDKTIRAWDLKTGRCLRIFEGHTSSVSALAWKADQRRFLSGCMDGAVRVWDAASGDCSRCLEGHVKGINSVAEAAVESLALSGSKDRTLRLWNDETGRCLRVFEGHTEIVLCVAWSFDARHILSASCDTTVRLWEAKTGRCLAVLKGHTAYVRTVAWSTDGHRAFSADEKGGVRVWDLSEFVTEAQTPTVTMSASPLAPDQVQYTNAKVLLVGESGAGKTGLSKRLALNDWQPSESTVGTGVTEWKLPTFAGDGVERVIWLWDFGGQADQRLIHQLYMDEPALAILVFDGRKEDVFEGLSQLDSELVSGSREDVPKLLVAGRVDAGGLGVCRSEVERFVRERKFSGFLETSAKQGHGCEELKRAIFAAIKWDEIPCRTTEVLLMRIREEIIRIRDEGRVLMRFNELRERLRLRLPIKFQRFTDDELNSVLRLLAGTGVVWELELGSWPDVVRELAFGSLVLLRPEYINAYAQAVIRTLQADEHQRGCLLEERVLEGSLLYEPSMERLQDDEERFILLAVHKTLVERGLCLRQPTPQGNLLVFPSYYRRERPDIVQYPAVQVNYRFTGFLDEVYATLVVRLHHSDAFERDELWRYAADFRTNTGKQLGIKLTRSTPGVGDLEVYFDPAVSIEVKIIFGKYVHEHLLQHARDVERLRHYVCPQCGTPVGNREVAMKRLNEWLRGRPPQPEATGSFFLRKKKEETPSIICVGCEQRVQLWDEMEQCFASAEIQQRVRDMQEEAKVELDNESKERALVGEVISTVALAAQISREKNVSDHGIDMEIEFKDDNHEATHRFLFLQLKSGDSYTRRRKKDGTEVFTIKDERHARYWMASPFPVLLVIRNSEGEVRWMEVRDWLKRESDYGKKPVKQIVFEGERFDVMSVRRWRERVLAAGGSPPSV